MRIELGAARLSLTASCSIAGLARPANPADRRRQSDPKLGRRPTRRQPTERSIDHTITQILAVSPRHGRPSIPKEQRTRTVRAIWESLQESENDEPALDARKLSLERLMLRFEPDPLRVALGDPLL